MPRMLSMVNLSQAFLAQTDSPPLAREEYDLTQIFEKGGGRVRWCQPIWACVGLARTEIRSEFRYESFFFSVVSEQSVDQFCLSFFAS